MHPRKGRKSMTRSRITITWSSENEFGPQYYMI